MSENTSTAPISNWQDAEDEDVSGIDPTRELLIANLYDLEVTKAEIGPNSKETGEVLKISLKTIVPCTTTEGTKTPAGYKLKTSIPITLTEDYTLDMMKKRIAQFMQAANQGGSWKALLQNPEMAVGWRVLTKVKLNKESAQFAAGNQVDSFVVTK